MTKYTSGDKIKAVKRRYKTKRRIATHSSKLQYWVKRYNYHGESAFLTSYTNFILQYKLDVIDYLNKNGTSIFEYTAIFNLPSLGTLWNYTYLKQKGLDALEQKNHNGHY